MEILKLKRFLKESPSYDFLRDNPVLGNNIILLGLSGSYGYGTNNENSDLDIRGIALNSKREILLGEDFKQVVDINTDTTIYSINKILNLFTKCNPNAIELLGLLTEHYLHISKIGQELLDNRKMFLSKLCINTFGNYAQDQLRRLEGKLATNKSISKLSKHMMHLIRLYITAIDMLEKEDIITYRKEEHNLLMDIREGKYLTNERKPTEGFYDLFREYEKRFDYAKKNTNLSKRPNSSLIDEFRYSINERVVLGKQ